MSSSLSQQDIQKISQKILKGQFEFDEPLDDVQEVLRQHECWKPYVQLLEFKVKSEISLIESQTELIRVLYHDYDHKAEAIKNCKALITKEKFSFAAFQSHILTRLNLSEFETVALLEDLVSCFPKKEQVNVWEFISIIVEKKFHDEKKLASVYKSLLALDPRNLLALRYFKSAYSVAEEWTEVVNVLQSIMENSTHESEKVRCSFELASVYLYHLDLPEKCIETIQQYCKGGKLDASALEYEAFSRLENWSGCINVLRECFDKSTDVDEQVVLLFKTSKLYSRFGDYKQAKQVLQQALALGRNLWEIWEELVHIAIIEKDWHGLLYLLESLEKESDLEREELFHGIIKKLKTSIDLQEKTHN